MTPANYQFLQAENRHIHSIVQIHNHHVLDRQTLAGDQGFLLAPVTGEEINHNLTNGSQYWLAVEDRDEVLGFVLLTQPKIDDELLSQIIWQEASCIDKILTTQHFYIKILAVNPNYMGQGIGQFLYTSLYQSLAPAVLSAFIVTKPACNQRSLAFHQRQGFRQIGTFRQEVFLDLPNYESILVFKEI
ncbi:MAG TPA: GNAT family N-acetyltransferase [Oscillatoriaceae cyanobacterium M33_DOE_052]|uniref:GNAT family N-acetyltransferase n=1 Tax=Planktothricoides sp. SpSt-374 TaxID=2282167 RepID=A0A7C3VK24_9CYAN|nr:GNAT family N-acetyltransferase [Oscillatoriaceae cyanobacterium M33_DOE_052]